MKELLVKYGRIWLTTVAIAAVFLGGSYLLFKGGDTWSDAYNTYCCSGNWLGGAMLGLGGVGACLFAIAVPFIAVSEIRDKRKKQKQLDKTSTMT